MEVNPKSQGITKDRGERHYYMEVVENITDCLGNVNGGVP